MLVYWIIIIGINWVIGIYMVAEKNVNYIFKRKRNKIKYLQNDNNRFFAVSLFSAFRRHTIHILINRHNI